MIETLLPYIKNIKGGPKTTITGAILVLFSMYLMYTSENDTVSVLLESGLIFLGIALFFRSDKLEKEDCDESK